jgi:hypothetical protein
MGAIILDGYSRAYVLNLAKTLRQAQQDSPLAHSLRNDMKVGHATAGPISLAMTVRERQGVPQGFELDRLGIGPEDLRRARLVAGSAVARVDDKTAVAFGFAEGSKAMQRRLTGIGGGAFLVARDVAGDPGFSASRNGSIAMRHQFGGTGFTFSGETGNVWQDVQTSATGSPYRYTSMAVDRSFGRNWVSVGMSRLEEKQSLLGGRMSNVLGGGGSTTMFVDLEGRHSFGGGWNAALTARRGWTNFTAGTFETAAYGFELSKLGVFGSGDEFGLRLAQPLRVEHGGFSMWLPTAYDYSTNSATSSLSTMSLQPSGRELDGEMSYGSPLLGGNAWFGGNFFYRRQPGHIAVAQDDVGAALRFTLGF